MKRHPMVSDVDIGSPDASPRLLGDPPRSTNGTAHAEEGERGLVLTSVNTWNHTLILTAYRFRVTRSLKGEDSPGITLEELGGFVDGKGMLAGDAPNASNMLVRGL